MNNIRLYTLTMMFFVMAGMVFSVATNAADYAQSRTSKNEQLVVEFYNKVFNDKENIEQVAKKYLRKDYIQHNPYVPTGRQGFIDAVVPFLTALPDYRADIKRVISDGDLVVLHIHAYIPGLDDLGSAVVDIFRVKNGKIAEHWDVVQAVPEQMAHDNGMF